MLAFLPARLVLAPPPKDIHLFAFLAEVTFYSFSWSARPSRRSRHFFPQAVDTLPPPFVFGWTNTKCLPPPAWSLISSQLMSPTRDGALLPRNQSSRFVDVAEIPSPTEPRKPGVRAEHKVFTFSGDNDNSVTRISKFPTLSAVYEGLRNLNHFTFDQASADRRPRNCSNSLRVFVVSLFWISLRGLPPSAAPLDSLPPFIAPATRYLTLSRYPHESTRTGGVSVSPCWYRTPAGQVVGTAPRYRLRPTHQPSELGHGETLIPPTAHVYYQKFANLDVRPR